MCETRKGVVTVPNIFDPDKMQRALAAATKAAASRVCENEQLIGKSVRIDGPGHARKDDDSLMDFHYTCTVMIPGCIG